MNKMLLVALATCLTTSCAEEPGVDFVCYIDGEVSFKLRNVDSLRARHMGTPSETWAVATPKGQVVFRPKPEEACGR